MPASNKGPSTDGIERSSGIYYDRLILTLYQLPNMLDGSLPISPASCHEVTKPVESYISNRKCLLHLLNHFAFFVQAYRADTVSKFLSLPY